MRHDLLTRAKSILYGGYHGYDPDVYLFGGDFILREGYNRSFPAFLPGECFPLLQMMGSNLYIPQFSFLKFGQNFMIPHAIQIDLRKIKSGIYRIIVVQNFQVEDRNPNIGPRLAGIILVRQENGEWVEPESRGIECRTLDIMGYVDTENRRLFTHDDE